MLPERDERMQKNYQGYRLDWENLRREWPLWVWMAVLLLAAVVVYPHLPERVPIHWNFQGQVDGYGSRAFGAFFAPLLCVGIYLLMLFLPLIDPKRQNYARFAGAYRLLRWGMVLFFSGLYLVTLLVSLGYLLDVGALVKAGVGMLLMLIGNFMGQFRHNYFVGIRTPWTLASEEVWDRTHRLSARLWVAAGLLLIALSPVGAVWAAYAYFALLMTVVFVPIVYSYWRFQKSAG